MGHFLSLENSSGPEILSLLENAAAIKKGKKHVGTRLLDQIWALIFHKPSTRTRVSFEVGIRQMGGSPFFLAQNEIQLGRGEPIKDTARVLGRMVSGAVIRTFAQDDIGEFARCSGIPTINALTDQEHPCQIMADLLTIQENRVPINEMTVCFLGDGDNNVSRSWVWAAAHLGFRLRIAAPEKYQPHTDLRQRVPGQIEFLLDPEAAAKDADVLYTDVWVSMGQEEESAERLTELRKYQLNKELLARARPTALVLHCLPAYRGKEITEEILETHADTIFRQAENRIHVQKAILDAVAGK